MTEEEKKVVIEVLKSITGDKKKLEKLINPNSQSEQGSKGQFYENHD